VPAQFNQRRSLQCTGTKPNRVRFIVAGNLVLRQNESNKCSLKSAQIETDSAVVTFTETVTPATQKGCTDNSDCNRKPWRSFVSSVANFKPKFAYL
jgi:hypothetical protein